ncbi:MAG: hypothetical protein JWM96_739 [Alphaproteobacteria bacterium]|nr:hypothetical protein [Alphaproteobacteria bacterium]
MKFPVLRVICPDQPGLVHQITAILARFGANIIRNDEFVDRAAQRFFMRTLFENVAPEDWSDLEEIVHAALPQGSAVTLARPKPKRIVICTTKEYHCLGDLLLRHHFGDLNAQILAVIANHDTLADLAARFEIPFYHLPHDDMPREEHEAQLRQRLAQYDLDYIVLAKYMRILGPETVHEYAGKIINIHHSFLPSFIGAKPYAQAFARGVKMIGATAHFVTSELDEGPIITQQVIAADHNDDAAAMQQAGREVELQTLARALKLVFDDRVFISGNKTVVF